MIRRPQQLLILRIVSMNFIFPTLIYSLLDAHHISPLWSIFYSGIPPSVDAILYLLMERRIDAINCVVLIGTVVGCAFAIVTNDPAMMLLKVLISYYKSLHLRARLFERVSCSILIRLWTFLTRIW